MTKKKIMVRKKKAAPPKYIALIVDDLAVESGNLFRPLADKLVLEYEINKVSAHTQGLPASIAIGDTQSAVVLEHVGKGLYRFVRLTAETRCVLEEQNVL